MWGDEGEELLTLQRGGVGRSRFSSLQTYYEVNDAPCPYSQNGVGWGSPHPMLLPRQQSPVVLGRAVPGHWFLAFIPLGWG